MKDPPWAMVAAQADGAVGEDLKREISTFKCGPNQVSGTFVIAGQKHKFVSTTEGLTLDDKYKFDVSSFLESMTNLSSQFEVTKGDLCFSLLQQAAGRAIRFGGAECPTPSNEADIAQACRDGKISCGNPSFDVSVGSFLYGLGKTAFMLASVNRLNIRSCKGPQDCKENLNFWSFLENFPEVGEFQSQKDQAAALGKQIQERQDAFNPKGLGLVVKNGRYELSDTPAASNVGSDDLAKYKDELVPLYRERDALRHLLQLKAGERERKLKGEIFERLALGRALLSACQTNEVKAEVGRHGLHLEPDSPAGTR